MSGPPLTIAAATFSWSAYRPPDCAAQPATTTTIMADAARTIDDFIAPPSGVSFNPRCCGAFLFYRFYDKAANLTLDSNSGLHGIGYETLLVRRLMHFLLFLRGGRFRAAVHDARAKDNGARPRNSLFILR